MKSKILFLVIFLITGFSWATAQEKNRKFDYEKFKREKAEFIKKEVGLSEAEAKTFIPLTEEFMEKKYELNKAVRQQARAIRKNKESTDAEYSDLMDKIMKVKVEEAALEKEYYQKFKKVLPAQKVYKYYNADRKYVKKFVDRHQDKAAVRKSKK